MAKTDPIAIFLPAFGRGIEILPMLVRRGFQAIRLSNTEDLKSPEGKAFLIEFFDSVYHDKKFLRDTVEGLLKMGMRVVLCPEGNIEPLVRLAVSNWVAFSSGLMIEEKSRRKTYVHANSSIREALARNWIMSQNASLKRASLIEGVVTIPGEMVANSPREAMDLIGV